MILEKVIIFRGNSTDPLRHIDVNTIAIPNEKILVTKEFDQTKSIGVAIVSRQHNCLIAEIKLKDRSLLGSDYKHFSCSFVVSAQSQSKALTLCGVAAIKNRDML